MSNKDQEDYCRHLKIELDHAHMIMRGLIACNENKEKILNGYRECAIVSLILCAGLLVKVLFFS